MMAVETGVIDIIMLSINPAYDMLPPSEDINILFAEDTFNRVYEGVDAKREALYVLWTLRALCCNDYR